MIRLLLPLLLLVIAIVLARRYIAAATPEQKKSRKVTTVLLVLFLVLLVLTLEHRMHWLAMLVPPAILALRKMLSVVSQFFKPEIHTGNSRQQKSGHEEHSARSAGKMTGEEALEVLGLSQPYTREDVIDAHRKLMQKLHPDRGGNDYLAATVNEAKDVLLKNR
jgi:hypothetical protein